MPDPAAWFHATNGEPKRKIDTRIDGLRTGGNTTKAALNFCDQRVRRPRKRCHLAPPIPGKSKTCGLRGSRATLRAMLHNLMGAGLLLAADTPNEAAIALSPTVGWLMLGAAMCLGATFMLRREAWRQFWLTTEDPRSIGLYRIIFGVFVIVNVMDFYEYFLFLFTDEGIFPADIARQVFARAQFEGFGDGFPEDEPWGFFDWRGVLTFLKGPKYSLLYIWDSPAFFWGHLAAFLVCGVLFVVGFYTRIAGIATFILMNGILQRNHLHWEGTELVYRVFLAYLLCARCGHAYSLDNWRRCRKLTRQGRLSTVDGPGGGAGLAPSDEHPHGLQAIYRRIPTWPRKLMMLQMVAVYVTTGVLKNGGVWAKGDAIYYAWSMDHFYRFPPHMITALLGTNLLRVATWVTHWGEALFFMVFLGILVKWKLKNKPPALGPFEQRLSMAAWLTFWTLTAAIIWVTWPVHFAPYLVPPSAFSPSQAQEISRGLFAGLWVAGGFLGYWLWGRMARKPKTIRATTMAWIVWGVVLALAALFTYLLMFPLATPAQAFAPPLVYWRMGAAAGIFMLGIALPLVVGKLVKKPLLPTWLVEHRVTLDQQWVARWPLGRRVWLTWHIGLMGGIFMVMNIGQFQTAMLSNTLLFLSGTEVARILWHARKRLGLRVLPAPIPAEDRSLPHLRRDAAHVSPVSLWVVLGLVAVAIVVRVFVDATDFPLVWMKDGKNLSTRLLLVPAAAYMLLTAWLSARRSRGQTLPVLDDQTGLPRKAWAYGPIGRVLINGLVVWQITGVATWLLPDKDCLKDWRNPARQTFEPWLFTTQTDQGWGMFAPNPPRSNVFLNVVVTDENNQTWDLGTDFYDERQRQIPFLWNDRMRKMNRRIIGGESGNNEWYRKWHARYHCRRWQLDHNGEIPRKVELIKFSYNIPPPEETLRRGYFSPADRIERSSVEKIEHTEHTIMGQLPNEIRARHGLPPLPDDVKLRPWIKRHKASWDRKHGVTPEKKEQP